MRTAGAVYKPDADHRSGRIAAVLSSMSRISRIPRRCAALLPGYEDSS